MVALDAERGWFSVPLFQLGFRPFYLLGALYAALAVPLWLASYVGLLPDGGYLTGAAWHSHEMLFGFAAAIIVGFLLTASANWSGQRTVHGGTLAGFAALWILGRILIVTGPAPLAAAVDLLFLPFAAVAIAVPLLRSRSYRNLFVVLVLLLLSGTNLLFHLEQLAPEAPIDLRELAMTLAVDVIAVLMAVIGGRIILLFTANAVSAARPRRYTALEVPAILGLLAVAVFDATTPWHAFGDTALAGLLSLVALLHAVRLALWAPWATRREPLLWILPLSYAWIPAALALRAAGLLSDEMPILLDLHAMTAGAMGGLMLAMMMRSSKGHTGRTLAASGLETLALILIVAAAVGRVFPPLIWPGVSLELYILSAFCWSSAFLIFFCRYWPILTGPRADSPLA